MHNHFNGLKTAALFGGIFALLLAIGGVISASTGSSAFIWLFALFGVGMTAYGYWNSDKLAIKAMHAYPVSEAQAPAMYRIVRELSTAAGKPMPKLYISPTAAPNASTSARRGSTRLRSKQVVDGGSVTAVRTAMARLQSDTGLRQLL